MSRPLHVIYGAGQVGSRLAEHLLALGCRVRIAKRSPQGVPAGAEAILGDAFDPGYCTTAAQGAAVLYHCINPEYSTAAWRLAFPRYATNLLEAAGRTGARLVVLDNLYGLGRPRDGRLTGDAPLAPISRKGEVRARVATQLLEAHRQGHARVVLGRASDFYGPGGTQTYYGDQFWPAALAGTPVRTITALDQPHTHHYIPDVAAALAELGTAADDVTGRAWMLPCAPALTPRAMIDALGAALGRPITVAPTAPWLQLMLSPFIPFLGEAREMAYQWNAPFIVDDAPWRERFGTVPTPIADGAAAMVGWARTHYAAARR